MTIAIREMYGQTLAELAANPKIVVLDADLAKATKSIAFKQACPERFFDMGIAEQDMIGTAAGFAVGGKIPFATTFAVFATGRAFDQIRNSVAYPKLNVKIAATHAGITVGYDGGTHQAVEDIALMRCLPNMVVLCPADARETKLMVEAAAAYYGPVYLRLSRVAVPDMHDETYQFVIGKGEWLRQGTDVTLIATGIMVAKALEAAAALAQEGIDAGVINMPTLKPIDEAIIGEAVQRTRGLVTIEEHSVIGGLGSAVADVVVKGSAPVPMRMIGIQDQFGCSGSPEELLQHYKLTVADIVAAARSL